jgi:hypothetical protein
MTVSASPPSGFELDSQQRISKTNPGGAALIQLSIEVVERHVRRLLTRVPRKRARWTTETAIRLLLLVPYTTANIAAWMLRRPSRNVDAVELYLDLVVTARKPLSDGTTVAS